MFMYSYFYTGSVHMQMYVEETLRNEYNYDARSITV